MPPAKSPQAALRDVAASLGLPPPVGPFLSCRCPVHDDRKASLSLYIGKDGQLCARCWAGCASEAVLAALDCTPETVKPPPTPAEIAAEIEAAQRADKKARAALKVWEPGGQPEPGTVGWHYLHVIRGLDLPAIPDCVREWGGLRHPTGSTWPALVVRVDDPEGAFAAVHRIWLDGRNGHKAPVEPQRALLAACRT
jgi:hypothetical protein